MRIGRGKPGGECDRPPGAPRRAGRVGERADGARPRGPDSGHESSPRRPRPAATPITIPIVERSSVGAPGAPTRLAPGLVRSGAASQPMTRPNAAATRARTSCSARRTPVTSAGVAPTAFSNPTRRVCCSIRPPTSSATLARARSPRRVLPVSRIACSMETISPSLAAIACQEMRKSPPLLVRVSEGGCVGRIGELQVERVAEAAASPSRRDAQRPSGSPRRGPLREIPTDGRRR